MSSLKEFHELQPRGGSLALPSDSAIAVPVPSTMTLTATQTPDMLPARMFSEAWTGVGTAGMRAPCAQRYN